MADAQPEGLEKASLAGDYLSQAVDALRDSGSADGLYGDDRLTEEEPAGIALKRMTAPTRRLEHSRTAILFAAIAAEAYVNAFLHGERFSASDRDALDRLPTVDKYVLAPRVMGHELFDRGSEPMTTLARLFDLRRALVHPKPELRKRRTRITDPPHGVEKLNPDVAAQVITAVSDAAMALNTPPHGDTPDWVALVVWTGRHKLRAFGRRAHAKLPALNAPAEFPLLSQIMAAENKKRERQAKGGTKPKT